MVQPREEPLEIVVPESSSGQRLDVFLAAHEKIRSRSRAAKLINLDHVLLKGVPMKCSYRISYGEIFQIFLPAHSPAELKAVQMGLDIFFEDADLLVVNKPAGLVVHPSLAHEDLSLVHGLLAHCEYLSMGFNENRPGIVHRLDKDTSGLLVVAKNDLAHHHLAEQFRSRRIHRIYWAVVFGCPSKEQGRLESYLARHPVHRKKFASTKSLGKVAITHFKVLKKSQANLTLLECRLETGRTHQIRVHLSELQHPIVGDVLYGSSGRVNSLRSQGLRTTVKEMGRIALHAAELGFVHPRTEENLSFKADWPKDLEELVRRAGFL